MTVEIEPGMLCGTVPAQPSKSAAHRRILCSALADGKSVIDGITGSGDILASLSCAEALGAEVRFSGNTAVITGRRHKAEQPAAFFCRESGSTLRFFLPAALTVGKSAVFHGTPRLMERGISVYEQVLSEKGIRFSKTEDTVSAEGTLVSGQYEIPGNMSSQFLSGLLFALPLPDGGSTVSVLPPFESRPYADMTLDILGKYGIRIDRIGENDFRIPGDQRYLPYSGKVEGDWSNAAALLAFNTVGGNVHVTGLSEDSRQGDCRCTELFSMLCRESPEIDLSDCPDLGPVLFAVSALKNGAEFTGTRRLRLKESDRVSAMAEELEKCGISVRTGENSAVVSSGTLRKPDAPLDGHNDHRIVMAVTLLLSVTGGTLTGAEAVKKSYPGFWDDLSSLGLRFRFLE